MSKSSKTSFFSYFEEDNLLTIIERGQIPFVFNQISPHIDKIEKVKIAIHFLTSLCDYEDLEISYFEKASHEIMTTLMPELIGKWPEISKLWSNYLEICNQAFELKWKNSDWSFFKDIIQNHLISILSPVKGFWKMQLVRSCLNNPLISEEKSFKDCLSNSHLNDFLLSHYSLKMHESLEEVKRQLSLKNQRKKKLLNLLKDILTLLISEFGEWSKRHVVASSIINGRFEKRDYLMDHSIVIGDDGGWYILLNKITRHELAWLIDEGHFSQTYIYSKIKQQIPSLYQSFGSDWYKIVIGIGNFGKIRLGVALLPSERVNTGESILSIGEFICLKKSKNVLRISPFELTSNTWSDYISELVGKNIHSPEIFDMTIITVPNKKHCKGYTMQQFLPVNDGTIFLKKDSGVRKWSELKNYFLDIFEVMIDLLDRGICMTDLKPSNTLYDTVNRVGKLIDLAGCVKKVSVFDLQRCKRKYIKEYSEGFTAPEIINSDDDPEAIIDLTKSAVFSIGKMIQRLVVMEYDNTPVADRCQNIIELKDLARIMTLKSPNDRLSIKEAYEEFQKIGPIVNKNKIDFTDFIIKIKEIIEEDKNQHYIGLKKDIKIIGETLINNKVSYYNPELSTNLEMKEIYDIDQIFNIFLRKETKKEPILLLLGGSGSGKSTSFQMKFLNLLFKMQPGEPMPFYINLATTLSVEDHWKTVNEIIKKEKPSYNPFPFSHFAGNDKYPMILFLDSFDESRQKCNLVIRILKELGNNPKNKILINCRSDYLQKCKDDEWFKAGPDHEFTKIYILPLNKYDYGLESYVKKFLRINRIEDSTAEYMKKIDLLNLKEIMQTCYMVYLTLTVLPDISLCQESQKLNKFLIYKKYTEKRVVREKEKIPLNYIQKIKNEFQLNKNNMIDFFEMTALKLAQSLHSVGKSQLNKEDGKEFFGEFKFNKDNHFSNQSLFNLSKILDLHMEIKGDIPEEQILLGFSHDMIKNYYIIKNILEEARKEKVLTLSMRLITEDETLVRFFSDVLQNNRFLIGFLKSIIYKTKTHQSLQDIIASANAITILVASNISFYKEDLSNVSICNANLADGMFNFANFTDADLSNANLSNCKLMKTIFLRTNLKSINLGILPDLFQNSENKSKTINSVCFSPKGDRVISGFEDGHYEVWDYMTKQLLASKELLSSIKKILFDYQDRFFVILGSTEVYLIDSHSLELIRVLEHNNKVPSMSLSRNSEFLLTSCFPSEVKYWEISSNQILKNFSNESLVICVSFASNDEFFVSGEKNKSIKLWEIHTGSVIKTFDQLKLTPICMSYSHENNLLVVGYQEDVIALWDLSRGKPNSLKGHQNLTRDVRFYHDGSHFLTTGEDKTLKLWDKSGKLLRTFEGHKFSINGIDISPDDKDMISCDNDGKIKFCSSFIGKSFKNYDCHVASINCIVFSKDKSKFLSCSSDKTVKFWDLETCQLIKSFEGGHTDEVITADFSFDENFIASGGNDNVVIVWNTKNGKVFRNFQGHDRSVYCVVVSKKNFWVASSGDNEFIRLWNGENGKLLWNLQSKRGYINKIYFNKENYLISCGNDGLISFWNPINGKCEEELIHTLLIYTMAISEDEAHLVATDYFFVKLWQLKTEKKCILTLELTNDQVYSLHFTGDSKYFMVLYRKKNLIIYDFEGNIINNLNEGINYKITALTSYENMFISGSADGGIKIWEKENEKWDINIKNIVSSRETSLCCKDIILKEVKFLSKPNEDVFMQKKV